jgi:hypothetical protein
VNRRPRLIAGLVTASVLVLTGCGGSGPRPGVAVSVGDDIVTEQSVDTASRGLCTFFADELAEQGAVAYREVRRSVAVLLTLRAAVDQLAEETGAEPGSDYRRQEASLESDAADVQPAAEREALLAALGAEAYVVAMVPEIGEALLREEGEADPDLSAANRRGLEALTSFLAGTDVAFSPALGLAYQDVELPPEDADVPPQQVIGALFDTRDFSTSVGVSETAQQGREPGPEYAASLPENQRCG